MKLISYALIAILSTSFLLWLGADQTIFNSSNFWILRKSIIYGSGIIAIIVMSFCILFSIRQFFSDSFLGGLDKRYKLHKWLGISGFVVAVIHWLTIEIPKWLVGFNLLTKPIKNKNKIDEVQSWIVSFVEAQENIAEDIAEWAFYAFVILVIIMLSKRISYKKARQSHKFIIIVYLVLVYHSVILMKINDWLTPLGIFLIFILAIGTVSALIALFGKIGHSKKACGQISKLKYYTDNKVLAVTVKLLTQWEGHSAGQFAFVTFDKKEGPHPFSITSNWGDEGEITFKIKQIGDYVSTLPERLEIGGSVIIEGPYGNFKFDIGSTKQQQIWIAGGIGIAPFLSKLDSLVATKENKPNITLYYSTNMPDDEFIQQLIQRSNRAGITLHIINTQQRAVLTPEEVSTSINNFTTTDVWFCGPEKFGYMLKLYFIKQGLSKNDFHQELFDMR